MPFWIWSKTSSVNASIDSSINYAEGQAPSSLNDSARAMMARLAEFRDDISGFLVTTGTSTALAVTTNQGLSTTPNDGQLLGITIGAGQTNGVSPTLTADGGTAFPIQSSAGVAVPSATLIAGTPYTLKFSAAASAWVLRNFYGNPYAVPIGGMMAYAPTTTPNSSFVIVNGAPISRTTYAALFSLIGTAYGAGDGSTTFNIPNLQGRVPAMTDNGNNVFPGLALGNAVGAPTHAITIAEMPAHVHANTLTDPGHFHVINGGNPFTVGSSSVGSGPSSPSAAGPAALISAQTDTKTTGITINNANQGGGNAMSLAQPTLGVNYIMRVI